MTKKSLTLTSPITAHGEQIGTLTFREPKGADMVACGIPIVATAVKSGMRMEINAEAMADWIAALAGIPPSAVAALSFADMAAAMGTVVGFFAAAIPQLSSMITLPSANGGATSPS